MKIIKRISSFILMFILMASFSQCSTAQKLQKESPTQFDQVYCENWSAGVQGGGSGLNIFIPVTGASIRFDSVYFRGKVTKLDVYPNNKKLHIGRYKTEINQPQDIVLSSDHKEEYANKMPVKEVEIPFDLKDNECVVSYQKGNKTMYYKIPNVIQKVPLNYPSAPANKQ